ncbi:unnamed protein product [Symbiodinium necroappetens]|uniref:Uncharacterized protein n=1 Tax=Symbiodinium necroappetens TaxID=1628268 RepID=A0A812M1T0_9DINO|nr:unnamed protein product [Symbiodinium necroappetens]
MAARALALAAWPGRSCRRRSAPRAWIRSSVLWEDLRSLANGLWTPRSTSAWRSPGPAPSAAQWSVRCCSPWRSSRPLSSHFPQK